MIRNRRRLLQAGGWVAALAALAPRRAALAAGAARPAVERNAVRDAYRDAYRISLSNLHTGEALETEFLRDGAFIPDSLASINVLLRDFRNDEQHVIDPQLMLHLVLVARHAGVDPVYRVISGYRSPQTNERLRERSSGVAKHSLHVEGRAIDVRLAGVGCELLAGRALDLTLGGVGFYRRSDFVHLDTGAVRTWKG